MSEVLYGVVGAVLAILFQYFPGLDAWYRAQSSNVKRLVMVGAIAVAGAVFYFASCQGYAWADGVACEPGSFEALVRVLWPILLGNQTVYPLLPKKQKVIQ